MLSVVFSFVVVFFYFSNVVPVLAQSDIVTQTQVVGGATGLGNEDPRVLIARIIRVFIGVLGAVALILVLYGGFLYMTAGGSDDKVTKAKKVLINAAIGLLIILSSYAIVSFIINSLLDATGAGGQGTVSQEYTPVGYGSGALGRVLQDHFPGVGMTVPRNTVIMVTFREGIAPSSILTEGFSCEYVSGSHIGDACTPPTAPGEDCLCKGSLNTDAVKVYESCASEFPNGAVLPNDFDESNRDTPEICNDWKGDPPANAGDLVSEGEVTITPDYKTFIFNPYGNDVDRHLGTPLHDVGYLVQLTNSIKKLDTRTGVFSGQPGESYTWNFTTNTTVDLTPPFITGVYPVNLDANGQPLPAGDGDPFVRNTKIRVDFSEPVLPPIYLTQTAGNDPSGNAELFVAAPDKLVEGSFVTALNQYRSVVFEPKGTCGDGDIINSCGERVFCLPADATIKTTVRSVPADNLNGGVGPNALTFPAGGIVDAALNGLDTNGSIGRGNGSLEGDADSFAWSFLTTKQLDLVPPFINTDVVSPVDGVSIGTTPEFGQGQADGVRPNSIVSAHFSEELNPATTTNEALSIYSDTWDHWYTGGLYCPPKVGTNGQVFCSTNATVAVINHADFTQAKSADDVPLFYPKVTADVQDMAGNCFNPVSGPFCDAQPGESCCVEYDGTGQMVVYPDATCPY